MLRSRAKMLAATRAFFAARDVLEVDTPVLGSGVVVEAQIDPIPAVAQPTPGDISGHASGERYLLSSPEGPMKRLLSAGLGAIYQIAHAFRDGESGRRHAPEFTILEWYRPGWDHVELMNEVEALVCDLIPTVELGFDRLSYREVFQAHAALDPFDTTVTGSAPGM